jgi:hypothetical protein
MTTPKATPQNAFKSGTVGGAVLTICGILGVGAKLGLSTDDLMALLGAIFTIVSAAAARWLPGALPAPLETSEAPEAAELPESAKETEAPDA